MSGLLSHSKNSIPVWFCLFWRAEKLHALSYALLHPVHVSHPFGIVSMLKVTLSEIILKMVQKNAHLGFCEVQTS